ncbi:MULTISPECIES: YggT family protein [Parafannyhessea]|uniref:YggT family protein n=2 Tax=Parafannyhessea umbonata TaxID=604330 RepID=A0A1G6HNM6_9ACTN|nr:YggT family protein [Parafannyhessea umbonata]MCI6681644.1 YggT family protein [Parafannyhessea umbonata]MCI7219214.1 YggT family protein [Parafannyhessea umbonata]MDD6359862.1 YggT family protein [Parafannyhessea umbonata]MDD6566282.1 YggT family protein [Parafannyhessea umbonata]MDD6600979.1 YggT family protein [Parafannyhessea umbonata]
MQIGYVVYRLLNFYEMLIFVQVLLSWFVSSGNRFVVDVYGALSTLVDPFVNLFRRFIPPFAGLDWSPFIAILVLQLVQRLVL